MKTGLQQQKDAKDQGKGGSLAAPRAGLNQSKTLHPNGKVSPPRNGRASSDQKVVQLANAELARSQTLQKVDNQSDSLGRHEEMLSLVNETLNEDHTHPNTINDADGNLSQAAMAAQERHLQDGDDQQFALLPKEMREKILEERNQRKNKESAERLIETEKSQKEEPPISKTSLNKSLPQIQTNFKKELRKKRKEPEELESEHVKRGHIFGDSQRRGQYIGFQTQYIDIYSPRGTSKIRIAQKPDQSIRITSRVEKRQELKHIEDTMESMRNVPDFGYDMIELEQGMQKQKAWDLLWQFIQNSSKYERLENYIQMRFIEMQQNEQKKKTKNHVQNKIAKFMMGPDPELSKKSLPPPPGSNDDALSGKQYRLNSRLQLRKMLRQLFQIHQEASNYIKRFKTKRMSVSMSPNVQKNRYRQKQMRQQPGPNKLTYVKSTRKQMEVMGTGNSRLSLNTKEEYLSVMSKIDEKSLNNSSKSRHRRGTICSNYSHSQVGKIKQKDMNANSNEQDHLTACQSKKRIPSQQHESDLSDNINNTSIDQTSKMNAEHLETKDQRKNTLLTDVEIELFKLLKQNYYKLVVELVNLCVQFDRRCNLKKSNANSKSRPMVRIMSERSQLMSEQSSPLKGRGQSLQGPNNMNNVPMGQQAPTMMSASSSRRSYMYQPQAAANESPSEQGFSKMNLFMQRLNKLRGEKMNIGALMRIVRSQKYEKLSENLQEVNDVERIVPELMNYHEFFGEKRDQSAEKRRQLGQNLNYRVIVGGENLLNIDDDLIEKNGAGQLNINMVQIGEVPVSTSVDQLKVSPRMISPKALSKIPSQSTKLNMANQKLNESSLGRIPKKDARSPISGLSHIIPGQWSSIHSNDKIIDTSKNTMNEQKKHYIKEERNMSPKRRDKAIHSSQEKPSIQMHGNRHAKKSVKRLEVKSHILNVQSKTEIKQQEEFQKETGNLNDYSMETPLNNSIHMLGHDKTESKLDDPSTTNQNFSQISQNNYLKVYQPIQGENSLSKFKNRNRERYLANRHIPSQYTMRNGKMRITMPRKEYEQQVDILLVSEPLMDQTPLTQHSNQTGNLIEINPLDAAQSAQYNYQDYAGREKQIHLSKVNEDSNNSMDLNENQEDFIELEKIMEQQSSSAQISYPTGVSMPEFQKLNVVSGSQINRVKASGNFQISNQPSDMIKVINKAEYLETHRISRQQTNQQLKDPMQSELITPKLHAKNNQAATSAVLDTKNMLMQPSNDSQNSLPVQQQDEGEDGKETSQYPIEGSHAYQINENCLSIEELDQNRKEMTLETRESYQKDQFTRPIEIQHRQSASFQNGPTVLPRTQMPDFILRQSMKTAHLKDLLDTRRVVHKNVQLEAAVNMTPTLQPNSSRLPQIKWGKSVERAKALKSVNWRFKNYSMLERDRRNLMRSSMKTKIQDQEEMNYVNNGDMSAFGTQPTSPAFKTLPGVSQSINDQTYKQMTPEISGTQSRNFRTKGKIAVNRSIKLTDSSNMQILEENHQEPQFNNRASELSKDKREMHLTSLNSDLDEKRTFNFRYSNKYSTLNGSNNPYLQRMSFRNQKLNATFTAQGQPKLSNVGLPSIAMKGTRASFDYAFQQSVKRRKYTLKKVTPQQTLRDSGPINVMNEQDTANGDHVNLINYGNDLANFDESLIQIEHHESEQQNVQC